MSTGYCFYNGGFDSDGFDTFLSEFKEAQETHDIIQVFIETNGGDVNTAFSLAKLFKTCESKIVVNVDSECSSSGFILLALIKDKCDINVSPTAHALVHLPDIATTIKGKERDENYSGFLGRRLVLLDDYLYKVFQTLKFTVELYIQV